MAKTAAAKTLLIARALPGPCLEELGRHCEIELLETPGSLANAEEQLARCHGLICLLTESIDRDLLAKMNKLEFVSSVSVGVDHIDVSALTERNIPVGNTPGVLVDATADLTMALLLAAARRVAEGDRYIREGQWSPDKRWSPDFFLGKDLNGSTLGIVGLGAIGQAVARRAAAFDMQVIGWTPSGRDVPGVQSVSLEELLSHSDFVSVHVALVDSTRDLISAEKIAAMKPGSVLVNTARGGIVNEDALVQSLDEGQLFAVGLDVFEQEPIATDHPLLSHPRAVVVPHIGSATARTRRKMVDVAVDNALAALQGQRMPHCVNPKVYKQ